MRRALVLLLLTTGCRSEPGFTDTIVLEGEPIAVAAGEELDYLCQSWTLGNDTPLYVNAVEMEAGPGWHHSNWTFVTDTHFEGPDGTWPCDDRSYEDFEAGSIGGVLFAQSTQVTSESQIFPAGAAYTIPAHARVLGSIHLVNASGEPIDTSIKLTLRLLEKDAVVTKLRPMSLVYRTLELPPSSASRFTGDCLAQGGLAFDFRVYYVLPHYHGLGTGFSLEAHGGPLGEQTIYSTTATAGSPLGGTIDPPLDVTGGTYARFSCEYLNTGTAPVPWGNRDGEMCVLLAYTDSPNKWAGGVFSTTALVGTDGNGVLMHSGSCAVYAL